MSWFGSHMGGGHKNARALDPGVRMTSHAFNYTTKRYVRGYRENAICQLPRVSTLGVAFKDNTTRLTGRVNHEPGGNKRNPATI
jgi:hypothetical protein